MKHSFITIFLSLSTALLISILTITYYPAVSSCYIDNSIIFEGFAGTNLLKEKISKERNSHQHKMDSIMLLGTYNEADISRINDEYLFKENEISRKYTSDIWKTLNQLIKEFAEKSNYDLVYGASGNGSLMYANPELDKTKEFLDYINTQYEGSN